jgi:hypothetical protein
VPGFDAAVAEFLKQGLGYVIAFIAGAAYWMEKRENSRIRDKAADDQRLADKDLAAINEKRLEETKAVVLAMERNTHSTNERTTAIAAQASAINELTKGFAALVLTQESTRARFTELGERLEARGEAALKMLRKLNGIKED